VVTITQRLLCRRDNVIGRPKIWLPDAKIYNILALSLQHLSPSKKLKCTFGSEPR
jgi:hypothetical protein